MTPVGVFFIYPNEDKLGFVNSANFAHFSLIRAILLHPDTANQAQLFHKPLDSLVVHREFTLAKFCRDPAIAVPAPVFVVNRCDFFLNRCIFVFFLHLLQMIVESCTGQLSDCEQNTECVFLP